jgi:hypothetical protein
VHGATWWEVDPREDSKSLNGKWFTGTFAIAGAGECRFIRLVNIGKNYFRDDHLCISAWEIFGSLVDTEKESSSQFPWERTQFAFPWESPQFPISRERVPGGVASLSQRPIPPTSISLFDGHISDLHEWSSNYLNHPLSRRPHQRPDLDLGDYSDGTEMNSLSIVCRSSLRNCHAENLKHFASL